MKINQPAKNFFFLFISDPSKLDKKMKFVVKEGAKYRIMLSFHVQREIAYGLKFINTIYKNGIKGKNFSLLFFDCLTMHIKVSNTSCLPKGLDKQCRPRSIKLLLKKQSNQGLPCLLF